LNCQCCGKPVDLPFKCSFCGRYFCADHRLPDTHICPEFLRAIKRLKENNQPIANARIEPPVGEHQYYYGPQTKVTPRWTSPTEIFHLIIGAVLVMAVGLSWVVGEALFFYPEAIFLFFSEGPLIALGLTLMFMSIFILHELAHKVTAKHYGLWAEFRLTLLGVLITMLSIFSPIKLISPGAVTIAGEADRKIVGKTALAGPLTNIMLSALFSASSFLVPDPLYAIMIWGAMLSAGVSVLNLIPISVLDGTKIFWWNKRVWAASFSASLTVTIITVIQSLFF